MFLFSYFNLLLEKTQNLIEYLFVGFDVPGVVKVFYNNNFLLLFQIFLPLVGILVIFFFDRISIKQSDRLVWEISYWISVLSVIFSCLLVYFYNSSFSIFQYVIEISWDSVFNFKLILGLDGVSCLLILLTNFLISLCILLSWSTIAHGLKFHLGLFFSLQLFLILSFSVLDIFWFYIFFESILIPMFLLIGVWGSRYRRIRATYQLFVYTAIGSLLLLFSIVYIYTQLGTTDIRSLYLIDLPISSEKLLWLALFISFSIKTPMFPFHIWLPEAHVEASTTGSVILAGILLKLGTYGMYRFLLPLFPVVSQYFSVFVFVLCLIGILYISYTILIQTDLKKIIAYSSIIHMSFVVAGLFSFTYYGIEGAMLMMVSHGFVASGLFIIIFYYLLYLI